MDLETCDSHCKNMYAKEDETLKYLLKMENEFREFHAFMLREMKYQRDLLERMWFLSQRYMILVSTGPCCKFNEVYSAPPEDVLLHEYNERLQLLRSSNCRIWQALRSIRYLCLHFEKLCSELDMTRETPLIIGDAYHKPISFFIELVDDLFKYFHSLLLSFKARAHQLDPLDPFSLEEYKKLLEPSEDFEEYLMLGLVYCKCLRPKLICDIRYPSAKQETC